MVNRKRALASGVGAGGGRGASVDVLREPAEALAVALPLQHRTHEQLQRPSGQLRTGHFALEIITQQVNFK